MNNNQNSNENLSPSENQKTSSSRESISEIKEINELKANLRQFCGTENYFRHSLSGLLFTDGIKYLADEAGAYWLIDAIVSYQTSRLKEKCPFQVWALKVNNSSGVLTMREDLENLEEIRQEIEYTDFPLDYIKLYLIDNVLLLPSEY